jgi:predicted DNA binding CopG/RHH family protein
MSERLDGEEREILKAFEQGKLHSRRGAAGEIEEAQQVARNTFNKTKRVNLRVTDRDFELAHLKAREEGIPYQTLLSSVIHKYLSGRLSEKS